MDQEDKSTLRKILELEQKNNKLLTSLHKSAFWGKVFRTFYYIVIIGAAIGAYYYVEPYIQGATDAYSTFKADVQSVKDKFK